MSRITAYQLKNHMVIVPFENPLGMELGIVVHNVNNRKPSGRRWENGDIIALEGEYNDPLNWKGGRLGRKYNVQRMCLINEDTVNRYL